MSAVPPLQAFTESAQRGRAKSKKAGPSRPARQPAPQRHARQAKESVTFDDDARRDFLTGFSKRKQARKQAAHDLVQSKIRQELKDTRKAAREARKERAAENVAAERTFYGLDDDTDDDEGIDASAEDVAPLDSTHEFNEDDRQAHVTVQTFNLDEDERHTHPGHLPAAERQPVARKEPVKGRARASGAPKHGSLTAILEPEVSAAANAVPDTDNAPERPAHKAKTFSYMSAAERAREREKQRQKNHAQAEIRRSKSKARVQSAKPRKKPTGATRRR